MLVVGEWIFVILMALFLLFAVVSNILVIYCIFRFSQLRTVTNSFICNLAMCDILLAGFVMPQKLHDISHENDFHEGEFLCKLVHFCPIFLITCSIYTLVSVSFERRQAIVHSAKPQFTVSKVIKIIPMIWIFGFLVSIPTLVEYSTYNVESTSLVNGTEVRKIFMSCGSGKMTFIFSMTNAVFVLVVSYVIPLVLMTKNYTEISIYIWKKGRQVKDIPGPTGRNVSGFIFFKHRLRLVKMMTLVATIFAVSWLPFFVILIIAKVNNDDASENAGGFLNMFLMTLAIFSTAYNIILYVVFNPSFRKAFKEILRCRKVQDSELQTNRDTHNTQFNFQSSANQLRYKDSNICQVQVDTLRETIPTVGSSQGT